MKQPSGMAELHRLANHRAVDTVFK